MKFLMPLEIPEPTADNHAATRKTVDDKPDVPPGGEPMQVVVKSSPNDFEVEWHDTAVAPGGAPGNVLAKASAADFDTLWIAPPGATIVSPLIIPDPVGAVFPTLRFATGDGDGSVASVRPWKIDLYNNILRFIDETRGAVCFSGNIPSVGKYEFGIGSSIWTLQADGADGYLRFFYGADRTNAELAIDQNGNTFTRGVINGSAGINAAGTIYTPGAVQCANVAASNQVLAIYHDAPSVQACYLRSDQYVAIQGYQGLSAPQAQILTGHSYATGNLPVVNILSYTTSNNYNYRPLIVSKLGGAGECAIGLANHVTGWTSSLQMFSDGAIYIASVNGANTATIKMQASAFQVISTRKFKAEIERLDTETRTTSSPAMDAIRQVAPVHYRDLQTEMALEDEGCIAPPPEGESIESREVVPVEPDYRFGLIAEEIQAVAPDAVKPSPFGPSLDMSGLVAILWQAVRELTARVDELTGVET